MFEDGKHLEYPIALQYNLAWRTLYQGRVARS